MPFVDFLVGLPVLVVFMWWYDTWPGRRRGARSRRCSSGSRSSRRSALGFFLSAINVRYRDVRYMIPVFLQVLPLLSGVMYAVEEIPDEVAVDPVAQPDDGRDQRAGAGRWSTRTPPDLGQTAVGVAVARRSSSSVGLAVFRSSEPRFADTI